MEIVSNNRCVNFAARSVGFLASTAVALGGAKISIIFSDKYRECALIQSNSCSLYRITEIASGCFAILGLLSMLILANSNLLTRDPSVIPNGSERHQPNGFFQSQQNGGPARYAEDDLQGTHRRPLGNYDPVQWDSGSQSI